MHVVPVAVVPAWRGSSLGGEVVVRGFILRLARPWHFHHVMGRNLHCVDCFVIRAEVACDIDVDVRAKLPDQLFGYVFVPLCFKVGALLGARESRTPCPICKNVRACLRASHLVSTRNGGLFRKIYRVGRIFPVCASIIICSICHAVGALQFERTNVQIALSPGISDAHRSIVRWSML